jgi:predicted nucleotidyltransferase
MIASRYPLSDRTEEIAALCRSYQVLELSLFGSAVRDDFGPKSDLDLLVLFQPEAAIGFIGFAGLQRELSTILGRPVDLVPKRGLKPLIRDDVLASAEIIYAAE